MNSELFAVIDTETNWENELMSLGAVVADSSFRIVDKLYAVIPEAAVKGGMFSGALKRVRPDAVVSRKKAVMLADGFLRGHGVEAIFAYNALFDLGQLPELGDRRWYDVMRIAAYRQYNPHLTEAMGLCSTGRLKRGYGVENVLRLISRDPTYRESHNALLDARDELTIMRLLAHPPEVYEKARIN